MKIIGAVFAAFIAVLLVIVLWAVSVYNGFVAKQEAVNGAWAQVQNVYQRRADLVPNLVETVKGAAKFEQSTLQGVIDARSRVGSVQLDKSILDNPDKFKAFDRAQAGLSSALSRLMVVIERYPDLKANANYRDLQVQLEGTENRIAVERRTFNEVVVAYNTSIRRMPAALVAGFSGFKERPYFEAAPEAQKAPQVQF